MQTTAHFDLIHETLIAELQKARQSVYVAVAWFTDRGLFQTLCERAAAGVTVELMLTNDAINFREGGLPFEALRRARGRVYAIGSGGEGDTLMHNKFCVIDGQTVITGSFNWSYKARQNHENITISTEAERLAGSSWPSSGNCATVTPRPLTKLPSTWVRCSNGSTSLKRSSP